MSISYLCFCLLLSTCLIVCIVLIIIDLFSVIMVITDKPVPVTKCSYWAVLSLSPILDMPSVLSSLKQYRLLPERTQMSLAMLSVELVL